MLPETQGILPMPLGLTRLGMMLVAGLKLEAEAFQIWWRRAQMRTGINLLIEQDIFLNMTYLHRAEMIIQNSLQVLVTSTNRE